MKIHFPPFHLLEFLRDLSFRLLISHRLNSLLIQSNYTCLGQEALTSNIHQPDVTGGQVRIKAQLIRKKIRQVGERDLNFLVLLIQAANHCSWMIKWGVCRLPCLLLFPVLSAHHPHFCLWVALGIAPWLPITIIDYRLLENLSWQQQWWVGWKKPGTGRKPLSFRFLLSYFGSVCWFILVLLAANSKLL